MEEQEHMIPFKDHMTIVENTSKRTTKIYITMIICWSITLGYCIFSYQGMIREATQTYLRMAYSDGTATNTNTNVNVNGVEEFEMNGDDE